MADPETTETAYAEVKRTNEVCQLTEEQVWELVHQIDHHKSVMEQMWRAARRTMREALKDD